MRQNTSRPNVRKTQLATVVEATLARYGVQHPTIQNRRFPGVPGRRFNVFLNYAGRCFPPGTEVSRIEADGGILEIIGHSLREAGIPYTDIAMLSRSQPRLFGFYIQTPEENG